MAFLFSAYIIIYVSPKRKHLAMRCGRRSLTLTRYSPSLLQAILGSLLGKYIDNTFKRDKSIYKVLVNVGGVQVSR